MAESISNPYDDVPYESHPFSQTHPNRLSTVAALFGLEAANLDGCRVLELGCCSGGNILPLAEQYPRSQFIGIDLSKRQIEIGQSTIRDIALKNVELHHRDILEFDHEMGKFDYVIAHGVFSWVPRPVQDKILQICRDHLNENGVAYISYNTYPGWRLRGTIRDIMSYRARAFSQPIEKLREARALLDFLAGAVHSTDSAYGLLLAREVEQLRPKQDWYLIHEYLEEFNDPEYFYQFMERVERFDLQYLGEADYSSMMASNFPPEVQEKLRQLSGDIIDTEQYMDLVRNRLFRQTLLCRKEIKLDRTVPPERAYGMHVASNAAPHADGNRSDLISGETLTFARPGSTLSTREPIVKAAMLYLGRRWPDPIPFEELLANSRSQLNPGLTIMDVERATWEARALAGPLLRCYATTHVDLHAQPPRIPLEAPPRPRTPKLARWQAERGPYVTTLRHDVIKLNDLERKIIPLLDGTRDRNAMLAELLKLVYDGKLILRDQGRVIEDQNQVTSAIEQSLEPALEMLRQRGLLIDNS